MASIRFYPWSFFITPYADTHPWEKFKEILASPFRYYFNERFGSTSGKYIFGIATSRKRTGHRNSINNTIHHSQHHEKALGRMKAETKGELGSFPEVISVLLVLASVIGPRWCRCPTKIPTSLAAVVYARKTPTTRRIQIRPSDYYRRW